MYLQLIDYIKDKSVLILGFGREGRSTYDFIRRHLPQKPLTVSDLKSVTLDDGNVKTVCGEGYMDIINDFDIVIKSPGISVRDVNISDAAEVTCQTDLFLRFSGCRCVGITGTKGKTTTSTLIYLALKSAGIPTCLIGNIGVPVFECIESCGGLTPVIEMSSHQLEFCRASPYIAVLTNIYEEHLDHYNGMSGYVNAKLNIMRNQDSGCHFICSPQKEQFEYYSPGDVKAAFHIAGAQNEGGGEYFKAVAASTKAIVGEHNRQDVYFAACVGKILGISDEVIARGIRSFKGIPHRMEYVGSFSGISFYNDAIATIPHAVMCAVNALEDIQTLIIGGMDRGLDYGEFIKELSASRLENIICLPETGHVIATGLLQSGTDKNISIVDDMEGAVDEAYRLTKSGHSCLLSPAASSYNRYKSFEHKGEHYKALVRRYANTP